LENPEHIFVILFLIGSCLAAWRWARALSVATPVGTPAGRYAVVAAPALLLLPLFIFLTLFSASDVRNSGFYLLFYVVLGACWLGVLTLVMPYLGLCFRDDVMERGNAAAVPAIVGLMVAWMLGYMGANVGDGPGWPVVVFCAVLACGGLAAAWIVLDTAAGINDTLTVDRDVAAGWRFGGFMIAAGLVLGRAVAGTWESLPATLRDFVVLGWPVVILVLIASVVERALRPAGEREPASLLIGGVAPAVLYLGLAATWTAATGWPT